MYNEDHTKPELAETKQNFIRTQNKRAITKKKTLSMINNMTSMAFGNSKKKEQLVELSNEENRVANFLLRKLEKNITLVSNKNSPSHLPIMEETSLIIESDNEEFSKEEKQFTYATAKKKTIVIRNPAGSNLRITSDSPKIRLRNLSKVKTSKALGFSDNLNKMDELKEKLNNPSAFSSRKKLTMKPDLKWGNFNESNLSHKSRKYIEENHQLLQGNENGKSLGSTSFILGAANNREGDERSKQMNLFERKRSPLDRKITMSKPGLNERKWNAMDVRKTDRKMTFKEMMSTIERKSENKIENGDSEESMCIEDTKVNNIEIHEEIKNNLKSTLIEDKLMEEIEFNNIKQKEKKYRLLSHKNLVYDSLSDGDVQEDIAIFHTINPDGNYLLFFNLLIFIAALHSIIFTPLYVAYLNAIPTSFSNFFFIMEIFIEILFVIDIVLNFYIGYYDGEEKLIVAKNKIANNYLNTWMLTDIVSALPIHTILFTLKINEYNAINTIFNFKTNEFYNLRIIILLRLIKILKVFLANKFTIYIAKNFFEELNATLYRVLQFLLYFSMMIHLLACIFIFIATMNNPNWISANNLQNSKPTDIYVASVYFIMATLFTIGYGDITSVNNSERIYNIFILMFGVLIYSYALSSLANFFLEKNNKEKLYAENKQSLETINNKYMLKPKLYTKIEKYLKFKLHTNKREETDFLNELPSSLKNEMIFLIYKPIIKDFVFFRNLADATKDFTVKVVMSLKPVTAVKNDRLVKEGEYIEEMIFIKNGILSLEVGIKVVLKKYLNKLLFNLPEEMIKTDESKDASSLALKLSQTDNLSDNFNNKVSENKFYKTLYLKLITLRNNEHFGDILMFLNKRSPLSVKVKSKTAHLFTMNKTEMVSISMSYPQIFEKICKRSAYNQKKLEILLNKTKYLFYKNNKDQFISEDFRVGNDNNFTHYFINSLDEEEIKNYMSSSPSVGKLNRSESEIDNESEKFVQEQLVPIQKPFRKSIKENNATINNHNAYNDLHEKLNSRVIANSTEEVKSTENLERNISNNNDVRSISKSSSNSTISEKSKCEEEENEKNQSPKQNLIFFDRPDNFDIEEENTYRSNGTISIDKNLNLNSNEIVFKYNYDKNLDQNQRLNKEINTVNSIFITKPTNNSSQSHPFSSKANNKNHINQLHDANVVKKFSIFSEFESVTENVNESVINEELNSDLSRDKARIKNTEIRQLVPFYSQVPDSPLKKNQIQLHQFDKYFPSYYLNDETIKNTISAINTNPKSPSIDPRQIQCNININNNINFNDPIQVFQSKCPNCKSSFFPISANRVLLIFPAEKSSQMKESISWTNMKVSHSNSFEINSMPLANLQIDSVITINNNSWRTSIKDVDHNVFDDDVKFKIRPIKTESNKTVTALKPESSISNKVIKKGSIPKRKNSIDVLHKFKNNLSDPFMKRKSSDKVTDILAINNKNYSLRGESKSSKNINRNNSETKTTKNNMLSVVYKNIQENSMNLNEPKSFYSNLLMGVMDEKHKNLDMMKVLIERLKGIDYLISNNSKSKNSKIRNLQDAG